MFQSTDDGEATPGDEYIRMLLTGL
jgi:hypothetical protein